MSSRVKIFTAIGISALIIAAGYLFSIRSEKSLTYEASPSPLVATGKATTSPTALEKDSDADGLYDWEELMWKTDTQKSDTDKDGTGDGEEVRNNRNPLVANTSAKGKEPSDLVIEKSQDTSAPTLNKPKTVTGSLARDILLAYLQAKQAQESGMNVEAPTLEEVLKKNPITIEAPIYSPDILKTIGNDASSTDTYGWAFMHIFLNDLPVEQPSELALLEQSLRTEDMSVSEKLMERAETYKKAVAKFLTIPVPIGAAALHIDFVNALSLLAASTEALSKIYTDPATGLAGLVAYDEAGDLIMERFDALDLFVGAHRAR